jgi:ankyrin repeat protein
LSAPVFLEILSLGLEHANREFCFIKFDRSFDCKKKNNKMNRVRMDLEAWLRAALGKTNKESDTIVARLLDERGYESREEIEVLGNDELTELGFREMDVKRLRGVATSPRPNRIMVPPPHRILNAGAVLAQAMQGSTITIENAVQTINNVTEMIDRWAKEDIVALEVYCKKMVADETELMPMLAQQTEVDVACSQEQDLRASRKLIAEKVPPSLKGDALVARVTSLLDETLRVCEVRVQVLREAATARRMINHLTRLHNEAKIQGFDGRETIASNFVKVEVREWKGEDEEKAYGGNKRIIRDELQTTIRPISLEKLWDDFKDLETGEKRTRRRVAFQGEAGAGKTTLLTRLAHEWANGALWNDAFQAVILIPLRNAIGATSMDELLLQGVFDGNTEWNADVGVFLKWCKRFKSRVLWILDGWDEVQARGVLQKIRDNDPGNEHIEYLLGGSRPEAIKVRQQQGLVCDSIVSVRGFSEAGIAQFIHVWCQKTPGIEQQIETALKSSRWLRDACKQPLMLQFVCMVAPEVKLELRRKTELYELVVAEMMKRFIEKENVELQKQTKVKRKVIKGLRKLAFENFRKGAIVVPLAEWNECDVYAQRCGLLKNGTWVHYTVQEFFAAVYICVDFVGDASAELMRIYASDIRSEVFFGFVCGIKGKAFDDLEKWFPNDPWLQFVPDRLSWIDEGGDDLEKFLEHHWTHLISEAGPEMLFLAVEKGFVRAAKFLISRGVAVDSYSRNGMTPFLVAASSGNVEMGEILAEENANLTAIDREGLSAVHLACMNGHLSMLRFLLSNALKMEHPLTDLLTTSKPVQQEKFLEKMYENRPASAVARHVVVRKIDTRPSSAIAHGDGCKKQYVGKKDGVYAPSPLHIACIFGKLEIVVELIGSGANLECSDLNGRTALHVACDKGRVGLVRMLIEAHARLDARDHEQRTPLHLACENGHLETVKVLLDFRACVVAREKIGMTPLEMAFHGHFSDIFKLLLKGEPAWVVLFSLWPDSGVCSREIGEV